MKKLITAVALIAAAGTAGAQDAIKLRLEPGSELSISGTSTVHAFTCKTTKIDATVLVDRSYTKDLTKVERPIVSVQVGIPVKSLDCGNGRMNNNMYGTLRADDNPTIMYTLTGYDLTGGTPTTFSAETAGMLLISGTVKPAAIPIKAERVGDNRATASGEYAILLTDFGIKPPSFMFGTLKVGNEIKIRFNLKAGPEMIAQLTAAMTGAETR